LSAFLVALALVGLVAGVAALLAVAWLLDRVLRPVSEIDRYAADTLDAGLGIARNLDGLDEILRTRDLGAALAAAGEGSR
jgi:hypothetical protein